MSKKVEEIRAKKHFLAVGPNTWGIGVTAAQAKAEARKHGDLGECVVFKVAAGTKAWVNDWSEVAWEGEEPVKQVVTVEKE